MLESYRKDLFAGEQPVKLANSLIGVEIRSFDRCSDDDATRDEIMASPDFLTQYYPYMSRLVPADLMLFQFYLLNSVYENDDLKLTVCAVRIQGGNAPYKGTRFQIDSQRHKQALILDFFDLSGLKVTDKHWLYSTLYPKKHDDPQAVQFFIDYIGTDQFLDNKFEPELNNFSFQTLYVHRMKIGEHIKPVGYVHQFNKVFPFFHNMVNQLKHYGVHLVAWLRPESKVFEFHHVGVPDTAKWKPEGALILHMVKSRRIEDGWAEMDSEDKLSLNELYGCQIFV